MSRRTSGKKEPPAQWFVCQQCAVNITSKARDQHEQHCPIRPPASAADATPFACSTFVHERTLYADTVTAGVPSDSLIADLPAAQLNAFVWCSESTMALCGWILGDMVECRSPQLSASDAVPVVRCVWPMPDRFGAAVYVTHAEFQTTWHAKTDLQLIVRKLPDLQAARPAAQITVRSGDDTDCDAAVWPELHRLIRHQFYGRVLSAGARIQLEFLNKPFGFVVAACEAKDVLAETGGSKSEDVADQLNALNLNESGDDRIEYFTVTSDTQFTWDHHTPDAAHETDANSPAATPPITFAQIGGLAAVAEQLRDLAALAFGQLPTLAGCQIARGCLLYGPPGCGKTLLAEALGAESGAHVVRIAAADVFSKYFGETEANLRAMFDRAHAAHPRPTLVLVEDVAGLCARDAKEEAGKRVAAAFLSALDAVHRRGVHSRVLVLATASNADALAAAARRVGRLDVELEVPVPNAAARAEILQLHVARLANAVAPDEVRALAQQCHGFVGADLASLVAKAALHATKKAAAAAEPIISLRLADLQHGFALVKPSAMREVLIECPNVRWSDIGGQRELKLQLKQAIEWPLTHPERFERMGIQPPRGILMFGPPGCSKTMIAKALATESKVNFLSIKGPELFSQWVGESERAVRELFGRARTVAPCIIFFDEIDAIGGERAGGSGSGQSSSVKERVLAQMLTEMDGVTALQNVTIVAATNRPDMIDSALMRPGRIDRIVYVRLPDAETRAEIFRIKMRRMPVAEEVSVEELVRRTEGYSGAEVQAVCQEAALKALEEDADAVAVRSGDFERALAAVQRRTSPELLRMYEEYLKNF